MTVSEIYNMLGSKLKESLPSDKWKSAYIESWASQGHAMFTSYYYDLNNEKINLSVRFGYEYAKAVINLNSIMTEGGHNKWNKLLYELKPGDKFNIKFSWDQEYEDGKR
ncbi:hypothetical protein GC194_14985 [bacterium]|nr:hypothetical protein [bacterium]